MRVRSLRSCPTRSACRTARSILTGTHAVGPRHALQRHPARLERQHVRARAARATATGRRYIGKLHLQNMGDNKASSAGRRCSRTLFPIRDCRHCPAHPEGWDALRETRHRHKRREGRGPGGLLRPRRGRPDVMHSDCAAGHYYQWLLEQGVDQRDPGRAATTPSRTIRRCRSRSGSTRAARGALPHALHREAHGRVPGAARERARAAILRVLLVPRPAPSLYAAGPLVRHAYEPDEDRRSPKPSTTRTRTRLEFYRRRLARRGEQRFPIMAPFSPTARAVPRDGRRASTA